MNRATFRHLFEGNKPFLSEGFIAKIEQELEARNREAFEHHRKTGFHLNADYYDMWKRVNRALDRKAEKGCIMWGRMTPQEESTNA